MAKYYFEQSAEEIQNILDAVENIDSTPTEGSTNPVTSGGVKTALDEKQTTIAEVQVSVDSNVGTPSGTASVSGGTLSLEFNNLKGEQGEKGDTVILGDEDTYTLYNVTGSNTDGAMTQAAVTGKYYELIGELNKGVAFSGSATSYFPFPFVNGNTYKVKAVSGGSIYLQKDGVTVQTITTTSQAGYEYTFTVNQDTDSIGGYKSGGYSIILYPAVNGAIKELIDGKVDVSPIFTNFTYTSGKYIHWNGGSSLYDDEDCQTSAPVAVKAGDVVRVTTDSTGSKTIIAQYENGVYTRLVGSSTTVYGHTFTYTVTEDMYIAVCGQTDGMSAVIDSSGAYALKTTVESLVTSVEGKQDKNPIFTNFTYISGKYIHVNGGSSLYDDDDCQTSQPVAVSKGDVVSVSFTNDHGSKSVIAQYSNGVYTRLVGANVTSTSLLTYTYTATEDMYIAVCGEAADMTAQIVMTGYYASKSDVEELKSDVEALESAIESSLPSYYESHVEGKIETINKLTLEAGENGDSFIFITDPHMEDNPLTCKPIIKKILSDTVVSKVINGGDVGSVTTDSMEYVGWDLIYHNVDLFNKYILGAAKGDSAMLNVLGNHDFNNRVYYDDDTTGFEGVSLKSRRNYLMSATSRSIVEGDDADGCYYYYDEVASKIRYIILDTMYGSVTGSPDLGDTQFLWFVNTVNTLPEGYDMIVVEHIPNEPVVCPSNETARLQRVLNIIKAVNNNTSVTISGTAYDYTDFDHKVLLNLAGHNHADLEAYIDNVLSVVSLNNGGSTRYQTAYNMFEDSALTKTVGTVTEQALDVFILTDDIIHAIRIGAGGDRHFHKTVYTVASGSSVNLTSLVSITPTSWVSCNSADMTFSNDEWSYPNTIVQVADGIVTLYDGNDATTGDAMVVALDDDLNKEFFYFHID